MIESPRPFRDLSLTEHNQNVEFFVTGGTMMPDAPSYVERQADRDLYDSLLEGKYCYVLTARQMGKSSLTARTAAKLRQAGIGAVVVDLAAIGRNLTVEQWYGSVLSWVGRAIELSAGELEEFWHSRPLLGPVQRWICALREIILPRYQAQLVIFVDEVDYVLDLPFPMDEFFAAVRECYNLRAEDAGMHRLTFCLVGVATPSDLIRNKRTTPFNIGRRIELHDFTAAEAEPLACGLRRGDKLNVSLLKRVLYWTDGHPFLTQRLCRAIAGDINVNDEGGVDRLCNELFFTRRAQELDDNLLFVRDSMLRSEDEKAALLDLYAKVRRNKRVEDDHTNLLVNILRLSGITRTEDNLLKVRNRIYECVFDQEWVERSMPDAELRRQRAAYRRGLWRAGLLGGVLLFLIVALAVNEIRRQKLVREIAQRLLSAAQPQILADEIGNAYASTDEAENLIRMLAYKNQIKQAQEAWEESNVSRVEELLNLCKPKVGEPDLRGFEWYYLWQMSHQESQSLKREYQIAALQMLPDNKRIAIGEILPSTDSEKSRYRIEIRDLDRGVIAKRFDTHPRGLFGKLIFTHDSRRILMDSSDNVARLLDTESGETLEIFKGRNEPLSAISISRDDQRVVTGDMRGILQFYEFGKGQKSRGPEKQQQRVTRVNFSPDGRRVASATGTKAVKIWDFSTGRELVSLETKEGVFTAAAFVPDGTHFLTATKDGVMQVWDLRTRAITARLIGHTAQITAIAFSPDGGKLATASDDRTAKLWDLATAHELLTIKGHGSWISAISWSSDGKRLATGSADKYVKIWDVEKMLKKGVAVEGPRVESYWASAFSKDGFPLAVAKTGDGKVKILRVPSGQELSTLDESANKVEFAVFSLDAERVATCGNGPGVSIWDVKSGKRIRSFAGARDVFAAAFSPDGKQLAFVYADRSLKSWDTTTGQELFSREADTTLSYRIAFSPDGESLAVACTDGDVILWNLKSGQPRVFKGHKEVVSTIAFSLDGSKIATGGGDNAVKLWEARAEQKLINLGQSDLLYRAAFSPDGKRLITGGAEGTVKIWDVLTRQELMILHKHASYVTSITFSNDGKSLVTSGEDGSVKIWRL
jgi:WD40 repeat protein